MADTISSTDLSRNLSEILTRVQHGGESFVVMRNGRKIAALSPAGSGTGSRAAAPRGSWRAFAESVRHLPADPTFADDLAEIQRAQGTAGPPDWPSS